MSRKIRRKKLTKQIDANDLFEMLTRREEVLPTTREERARIAEQLLEETLHLFQDAGNSSQTSIRDSSEES